MRINTLGLRLSRSLLGCLLTLFVARCGGTNTGSTGTTGNSNTPPAERTSVNVRFVHLYSPGQGAGGGAVDVYRTWNNGGFTESTPVISGLKFGEASPFVHPLADSSAFAFYNAGSKERVKPYEGFNLSEAFDDNERATVVIGMTKSFPDPVPFAPLWNVRTESALPAHTFPPAANPTQMRVVINTFALQEYPDDSYFAGVGGICLNDTNNTGSEPEFVTTDRSTFEFAPGTVSIGLYKDAGGRPNCTGTPTIGPASVTGTAGSRTWLYLYATSATDLRTLALPLGE